MTQLTTNQDNLKQLFKKALAETLDEQCELLRDIFADVLEEFALAQAIQEGQRPKRSSEIMKK